MDSYQRQGGMLYVAIGTALLILPFSRLLFPRGPWLPVYLLIGPLCFVASTVLGMLARRRTSGRILAALSVALGALWFLWIFCPGPDLE